jgi:light-regulated signal transduction histidine kinase (bacteriophytochrome)
MRTADDLKFLQAAIDSQKDVLICSIDRDYTFRTFNNAFRSAASLAYGTDLRLGMSLLESMTSEDHRRKAKAYCDRALQGETLHTVEEYGTLKPSVFETFYDPISTEKGNVIGVSLTALYFSEKAAAERKIETLTRELESFTYTAAHDLRVPLRVIDGYSKILAEDYQHVLDDEGLKLVGIIGTHVKRMGRLIDDLLDFSKLGRAAVTPRLTNIRDIVQQVIDEQVALSSDSRTGFAIGDLPAADCDPVLIRIVLTHLISNAIKFSSMNEKPVVEVGAGTQGSQLVYFVKDNGVGFNMDYSSKLFGLFQRLHKPGEFEGTGVGLAIVQRIVGKHGGRVWFHAEVNKGATFYFTL